MLVPDCMHTDPTVPTLACMQALTWTHNYIVPNPVPISMTTLTKLTSLVLSLNK